MEDDMNAQINILDEIIVDNFAGGGGASTGMKLDNATNFSGQPLELFSGEYIADEYGVAVKDKFGYEQVICRHPIMPVQRLCNIDSGEERLEVAYRKGRSWRSVIVEKPTIASSSGIFQSNEYGDFPGEVWGKDTNDCIYIIKSVFDREMSNAGFNATAFLSWAKRVGLLSASNGRRTKIARVAGSVTNCVCILKNDYEEITEADENCPFE